MLSVCFASIVLIAHGNVTCCIAFVFPSFLTETHVIFYGACTMLLHERHEYEWFSQNVCNIDMIDWLNGICFTIEPLYVMNAHFKHIFYNKIIAMTLKNIQARKFLWYCFVLWLPVSKYTKKTYKLWKIREKKLMNVLKRCFLIFNLGFN